MWRYTDGALPERGHFALYWGNGPAATGSRMGRAVPYVHGGPEPSTANDAYAATASTGSLNHRALSRTRAALTRD